MVVIGVSGAAIGAGLIVFGIRKQFLPQFDAEARTERRRVPIALLGQIGYVAKGLAYLLIGGLLAWAGLSEDPQKAGGLDQTVRTLLGRALALPAMLLVAAGIACFGCYLFALARHLDRESMTSAP